MKPRQRGYLLIALLLTLTSLSAVYLTAALKKQGTRTDWRAQRQTLNALHDTKLALIAHGLIEDNTPGTLPSPSGETNVSGGSNPIGFTATPGQAARRVPWSFLGLQNRSDGNGDCLWYAVSKAYSNIPNTGSRNVSNNTAINPSSPGVLKLNNMTDPVAAVLISGGATLSGQQRGTPGSAACASGTVDQFLEGTNAGTTGSFINDTSSETFNDTVLGITHSELLKPVLKRVLHALDASTMRKEITTRINAQPGGATTGSLASLRDQDRRGFDLILDPAGTNDTSVPCPIKNEDYKHPVSWLCYNDWYSHIVFQRNTPTSTLSVSLASPSTYRCAMALGTGQISCTN